jgi:putative membrane protein
MRKVGIATAAFVLLATSAFAQDKSASQKFLTEAIQGNYAEVEMGKLAQKNGQSQQVKSFGQMLATDHGSANEKAMQAAKSMGLTYPNGPNAQQKSDHDKMAKMTGAQFDKEFAQHMVKDHQKDIAEYEKESKMQDAAGKYAQETLPTLKKHLETAQNIEKSATTGQR